ncbi:hypothetical protein LC613_20730 [Nostoc sphaeroides CHAB 2801]|uniref:Uncharacterized protein n=1 Tax=Nostoc sphaeroides CCNUC1 TaxID=2653204 RepID=A0A5P8W0Q5_9NOSO|nr:hypothetical protein [Nostoc sphaeroides]MCC5630307.1 hypothetical protein [Nostoc sphaeroides CHAB 2801]QFS46164.1 hypothetical protein GXM_03644 [Nostoc sphaeroides CCNUC1]
MTVHEFSVNSQQSTVNSQQSTTLMCNNLFFGVPLMLILAGYKSSTSP